MKKLILVTFFALFNFLYGQQPTFSGARFFSGQGSNYIYDIALGPSNIYAVGEFRNDIQLGSFLLDEPGSTGTSFIMKCDSAAEPIWVTQIGTGTGSNRAMATALCRSSDGSLYAGGYFFTKIKIGNDSVVSAGNNNCFIAKFNDSGNLVWLKGLTGSPSTGSALLAALNDMECDSQGNLYFTGFFSDAVTFNGTTLTDIGPTDIFYGKLDPAGNTIWFKKAGGYNVGICGLFDYDNGNALSLDLEGNIYIAGHFAFDFIMDGQTLTGSGVEAFVAKIDNAGNLIWLRAIKGEGIETARAIGVTKDGGAVVGIEFMIEAWVNGDTVYSYSASGSPYDLIVVKYDASGTIQWYQHEGHNQHNDFIKNLVVDDNGNIFVMGSQMNNAQICGSTLATNTSWDDRTYIACYTDAGVPFYVVQCGGERNFPYAMALTASSDLIIAGSADKGSTSGISFGSYSCPGPSGHYPYITTLDNSNLPAEVSEVISENEFSIYPNPASNHIGIHSNFRITSVEVYDLLGQKILGKYNAAGIIELNLNCAPGIYTLKAGDGSKSFIRKISIVN